MTNAAIDASSDVPERRGPSEQSTSLVLAMIAASGLAIIGGIWLLGVLIGPQTQPYCGAPDVPGSCSADASYRVWAVPPLVLVLLSLLALILLRSRSRASRQPS